MNPSSNDTGRLIRAGLVDFYAPFIHPGELVFDLGANISERAVLKGIPSPHYRPFWGGDVYARTILEPRR